MRYIDYNNFYKRFEAERIIKGLAIEFPHSYHISVFICGREFQKSIYQLYSAQFAKHYTQKQLNLILKVEVKENQLDNLVLDQDLERLGCTEFNIKDT